MTVKGYGTGEAGEANNETHALKKLDMDSLKAFRDRFDIPINDKELETVPFYKPPQDSAEMRYMRERREELGGLIPKRRSALESLETPPLTAFGNLLKSSGKRETSTTMAFVRILSSLVERRGYRTAGCADSARRGAHLWHGRHVSSVGYLLVGGAAIYATGCRPNHVLQGRHQGSDPGRRYQRGGCFFCLARGGYLLIVRVRIPWCRFIFFTPCLGFSALGI